jgi:hypothetical protein
MASEFATQLAHVVQGVSVQGAIREADAQLAEVREVLEGIRGFYGTADCWCDSEDDAPHFEHCQRARALYERLKP